MSDLESKDPQQPVESGAPADRMDSHQQVPADPAENAVRYAAPSPPPPPPPTRKSSGIGKIIIGIVFGGLAMTILLVFVAILTFASADDSGPMTTFGRNKVAVVPIQGEIVSASPAINQLSGFANNRSIRAIVVRINSPGGAVAPSQELYAEILRIREETGKPVVASFDTVAASGGYYIAAACDQIVANPGSITGSIGVIAQWFNLEELVEWAKLEPTTFKSGELKDAGSPYREMTPKEQEYYQRIVSQLHEQFIVAVIEGRTGRMTEKDVRTIADGRVFTGEEAVELKLVDSIGGLNEALRVAGDLAGIKGEPTPVYPRVERPGLLDVLAESREASGLVQRILSGESSPFLYRW